MSDHDYSSGRVAGFTGVALAGGLSSRMGEDKAGLEFAGLPLISHVTRKLATVFTSVLIIGPERLAALHPGAPIVPDARPGLGPLGALATALDASQTPWLFLAACDMPLIQPSLVRHIAARALASPGAQAVAISGPHGLEPLHAAYRRDIHASVWEALDSGRASMRGLLASLRVVTIDPQDVARFDPRGLSAYNANTPDEWREALALAERDDNSTLSV